VLGARRQEILRALLVEFGLIGVAVSALAAALGGVAAWILVTRYLKLDFAWLPSTVFTVVAVSTVAVILIGLAGTWRALGHRPAASLRQG
jgi:putative ABC transport system permease protein